VSPPPYSFSFEPLFLALAAVAAVAYARARPRPPRRRAVLFALGLALVAGALNSPLETLAAHYLLVVHLLQNVMIADWAPPLLILGLTPALRAAIARRGGRSLERVTDPRVAVGVWLVGWYGIHLAGFYDLALRNPWLLNVEHALLLAIGLLFWWPVLADDPQRLSDAAKVAYLGVGFVGSAFLGLALTFSPTPFYDYYVDAPRLWGLSAAQDQNLGGVLMSVEQAFVFLAAIAYFVLRLVPDEEGPRPDDAAHGVNPPLEG
jgi:cytochrome c oxidase assembly factor CtaG